LSHVVLYVQENPQKLSKIVLLSPHCNRRSQCIHLIIHGILVENLSWNVIVESNVLPASKSQI